ncbi:MAG: methyltransferase domain-containing protein [Myxococcales bacterium]|nr:methyltransferase domain-containing protein [Myxococcales bacterium]
MQVDFGRTAEDYARYRGELPAGLLGRLERFEIGRPGQRVLDLGTGTGVFARAFAAQGAEVVGLDRSAEMLDQARAIEGPKVDYVEASAERTLLDQKSFDVVSVAEAWHWFDRPKVMREIKRVLKPAGRLVIVYDEWLPLRDNAVQATEKLIESYNPDWKLGGGTGLHPTTLTDVRAAGFVEIESFSFDDNVSFSHEAWRGRVRASAGVLASLSAGEVARFDEKLRRTLEERFADEPLDIPFCVWAVVARAPG